MSRDVVTHPSGTRGLLADIDRQDWPPTFVFLSTIKNTRNG